MNCKEQDYDNAPRMAGKQGGMLQQIKYTKSILMPNLSHIKITYRV